MHPQFQLYVVSVDFVGKQPYVYRKLERLLDELGAVLKPTHQMILLLSPLKARAIRDRIKKSILESDDRVYVGKIARGSAWCNLLHITGKELKVRLQTWAKSSKPSPADFKTAKTALSERLPRRKG